MYWQPYEIYLWKHFGITTSFEKPLSMLCRADTARTMVSRAHSTGDLSRGLSHILLDADAKLPDDLEELQEHWGLIQSLEGVNLQVVDFCNELPKIVGCFVAYAPTSLRSWKESWLIGMLNPVPLGPCLNDLGGTCFYTFVRSQQSPANCVVWNLAHN